jgi:superoxide reductase
LIYSYHIKQGGIFMKIGELVQSADFKSEKHVPFIDAPDSVKAGEPFFIKACVGKEIPHPNKMEHHIAWIQFFFKPADSKFAIELAKFDFTAHGAAMDPAAKGPAATDPTCCLQVKLDKPGTIIAQSYCNIHGLWESSKDIAVA